MENQSKPNDLLVSLCWYTERYKEVLFFSVVILFLDSLFGVAVFRRVHPHHVDAGCPSRRVDVPTTVLAIQDLPVASRDTGVADVFAARKMEPVTEGVGMLCVSLGTYFLPHGRGFPFPCRTGRCPIAVLSRPFRLLCL